MTNEERDLIAQFIQRVSGYAPAQAPSGGFAGGSVPQTARPALPPVDPEADQFIGQLLTQYPEARYRLTQTAFVQEHALVEAQNRIRALEAAVEQLRQQLAQVQAQGRTGPQQSSGGGFFSNLFGGGSQQRQAPPPQQQAPVWNQGQGGPPPGYAQPQPQYAPGYQPGMFQRQGSGFLGSALTTAAGVAGGLVVGNALMDLFSPHQTLGGGLLGQGAAGAAASGLGNPWGGDAAGTTGAGYVDQSSWTTPPDDPNAGGGDWAGGSDPDPSSSWDDAGSDPGGSSGWDDGGGSDDTSI